MTPNALPAPWGVHPLLTLFAWMAMVGGAYVTVSQLDPETSLHANSVMVWGSCAGLGFVVLAHFYRARLHVRGGHWEPSSPCRRHVVIEVALNFALVAVIALAVVLSGLGLVASFIVFAALYVGMFFAQSEQDEARAPRSARRKQKGKVHAPTGTQVFCKQTKIGRRLDRNSDRWPDNSIQGWLRDQIKKPVKRGQPSAALTLTMIVFLYSAAAQASVETAEEIIRPAREKALREAEAQEEAKAKEAEEKATASSEDSAPPASDPDPRAAPLCSEEANAGAAAPEPQGPGLSELWTRYGTAEAGCPGTAEEVSGHPGVWYAIGKCPGQSEPIQGLGVATTLSPAAMLFDQAAEHAADLAISGYLSGATERFRVGPAGDAYIVDAENVRDADGVLDPVDGSHVLVREESGHGVAAGGTPCDAETTVDAEYVLIPPALIGGWLAVAGRYDEPVWPTTPSEGSLSYTFEVAGRPVAHAECSSDRATCTTTIGRETIVGVPGRYINQTELEDVVFQH